MEFVMVNVNWSTKSQLKLNFISIGVSFVVAAKYSLVKKC